MSQASSNSLALGNYYCERRQVPPNNVLFINWTGGNTVWTNNDFQTILLGPLLNLLATRRLTNQVDYVVLSMDIPFQVNYSNTINSTTSALFYGLKPGGGTNWNGVTNSYAGSEAVFRQSAPASAPGYSFLTTMITANTLAQAQQMVDQGVNGDATFPSAPVTLVKTSDPYRNIRYSAFDNAIFNTRIRGNFSMWRTSTNSPWLGGTLLGCQFGMQNFAVNPGTFVPGAIADDLTSYGGIIFGYNDQTTLFAFINAGAAGSYGTVTEPTADISKFPDPQDYFYQARGFSLAECYYQSLVDPYEGLVVGEPLAAPFAQPAVAAGWSVASNAVLHGTVPLATRFAARDLAHPLQQIDLFVDGLYYQTLTNLGPRAGNSLSVTLNGYPVSYSVPTNASVPAVAAGLAAQINAQAVTNLTKVMAVAHGDRIELHSVSTAPLADPAFFSDTSANPGAIRFYRVVYLGSQPQAQLGLIGRDADGAMRLHAVTEVGTPYVIEASTNLHDWVVLTASSNGGPIDFVDVNAPQYPRRFYRVAATVPDPRPVLSLHAHIGSIPLVHIDSRTTSPYVLQASTNLTHWTSVFTNSSGGAADFVDNAAGPARTRFYRAALLPPPTPQLSPVSPAVPGSTLLRVDGALQPFVIDISTNLTQWTPIYTNLAIGKVQLTAASSVGTAKQASTFLSASQGAFLDSTANGLRAFSASGIFQVGTWMELDVTKTNGSVVTVSVTNFSSTAALLDLTTQLVSVVNATPALMGADGLVADDLTSGAFGAADFNLRARSPGLAAAGIQARLGGTSMLVMSPKAISGLTGNLSDLQPRNHLYVTTGAPVLGGSLALDTTTLSDGFHVLTAVAYEGSNVRTQTRSTLPVRVQNSALAATLTLLDLAATAPVQGTYHIQVTANTNTVSAISLFGTGGLLGTITNQSSGIFTLNGPALGVGLHPFYATVQTADRRSYRTDTYWVRLY